MDVIVVPCLFDNYAYILYDKNKAQAVVIDPSESWPVLRVLDERGLVLKAVLCTHHHHDHIGGIDEILGHYSDKIRVIGYGGDAQRIPQINEPINDGDSLTIGDMTGKVFHTPGHTTGAVVYSFDDCLFTGDTLFGAGCGRLFEGTAEQMYRSLQKIKACGAEKKVYFGHEYTMTNLGFAASIDPHNNDLKKRMEDVEKSRVCGEPSSPSTIAEELRTNPFLRCEEPAIIEYLERNSSLKDTNPVSVFTRIRELRNNYS